MGSGARGSTEGDRVRVVAACVMRHWMTAWGLEIGDVVRDGGEGCLRVVCIGAPMLFEEPDHQARLFHDQAGDGACVILRSRATRAANEGSFLDEAFCEDLVCPEASLQLL